jgi:tetratricopeptide (TPR) repeat protein
MSPRRRGWSRSAAGGDAAHLGERARAAFRAAGDRAISLNAFSPAVAHYRRALELADGEDARLLLRYGLARFLDTATGEDELLRAVERLLAEGDAEGAAEAQVVLVELAWISGNRDLTDERLERAEEIAAELPVSRAKAYALSTVSRFRMLSGRHDEAIRAGEAAIAMALELGADDIRIHALSNVGPALANAGDIAAGRAALEEAVELGKRIGSSEVLRAYVNLASVVARFDQGQARPVHQEGLELATKLGHGPSLLFLRGELAADAWFLGDWELLVQTADEYEADAAAGAPHYLLGMLLTMRGFYRLARVELDAGVADSERALGLARKTRDPQTVAPALGGLVAALVDVGRGDEARGYLEELLGDPVFRVWGLTPEVAKGVLELGRADEILSEFGDDESAWHRATEAILREDFVAAADIYESASALPEAATTRLYAAEQLLAGRRRAEAEQQLEQALAFWRSVGATRYIARAEALRAQAATG